MTSDQQVDSQNEGKTAANSAANLLSIYLPTDNVASTELLKALQQGEPNTKKLLDIVESDPVLALLVVHGANRSNNSSSPECTSIKDALISLGVQKLEQQLQIWIKESSGYSADSMQIIQFQRQTATLLAPLARIIANYASRPNREQSYAAALLSCTGDMLAAATNSAQYNKCCNDELTVFEVRESFSLQHKYDFNSNAVQYLKAFEIPAVLHQGCVSSKSSKGSQDDVVQFMVKCAKEVLLAHQENVLESWKSLDDLPATSPLKNLNLSETEYGSLHSALLEHLQSCPFASKLDFASSTIGNLEVSIDDNVPLVISHPVRRLVEAIQPPPMPETQESNVDEAVDVICEMFTEVDSAEEALSNLLDLLLYEGPFMRSALMKISPEEQKATAIAASGIIDGELASLKVTNPLSPLLRQSIRVESFAKPGGQCSPFGSQAFILSPVDVQSPQPIVLYADCGPDAMISFEARRVFRKVVEKLNVVIKDLPSNVPDAFED